MAEKYSHAEDHADAKNLAFLTKDASNNLNSARFLREERLKNEKIIEQLFSEGKAVHSNCLTLVYLPIALATNFPAQTMFSVSKRNFKHAVDRNRIKRQLRESYRLQKKDFYDKLSVAEKQLAICFLYKSKLKIPYAQLTQEMQHLTQVLLQRLRA